MTGLRDHPFGVIIGEIFPPVKQRVGEGHLVIIVHDVPVLVNPPDMHTQSFEQ